MADVAQMRQRGVDVSEPRAGVRQTPTGQALRWKAATLGLRHPLPIFFIEHLTPLHERRRQASQAGPHPNGVLRVDRVYIAVAAVAAAAETYSHVLGMPVPQVQRGAVIKADMAVFDLGPTGLTVAQPAEPGPAADALAVAGQGRSRYCTARAAWTPRRAGWRTITYRRRRVASATPANRRCSCDRTMRVVPTSASWDRCSAVAPDGVSPDVTAALPAQRHRQQMRLENGRGFDAQRDALWRLTDARARMSTTTSPAPEGRDATCRCSYLRHGRGRAVEPGQRRFCYPPRVRAQGAWS